jgi:hypothetical protein
MANLLVGSSNVARFYEMAIFKQYREYKLVKCTNGTAFEAHMENLTYSKMISVVENFLADKVEEVEPLVMNVSNLPSTRSQRPF